MRLVVSCLTGLMSGLAGILLTSRIGSTRPNIANGWELEVITTVVLGGVAITGGKGNLGGVILGIFLLGFLRFGMGLINVPSNVQNIFSGVLLILAILLPGVRGASPGEDAPGADPGSVIDGSPNDIFRPTTRE